MPGLNESRNKKISTPPIVQIFTCKAGILLRGKKVEVYKTMIDSGATSCFMDRGFAERNGIMLNLKPYPIAVEVIDGRQLESGYIREETIPVLFSIGQHEEYLVFNIIKSPKYPLILGMSWLTLHNPRINWNSRVVEFDCGCNNYYNKKKNTEKQQGVSPVDGTNTITQPQPSTEPQYTPLPLVDDETKRPSEIKTPVSTMINKGEFANSFLY